MRGPERSERPLFKLRVQEVWDPRNKGGAGGFVGKGRLHGRDRRLKELQRGKKRSLQANSVARTSKVQHITKWGQGESWERGDALGGEGESTGACRRNGSRKEGSDKGEKLSGKSSWQHSKTFINGVVTASGTNKLIPLQPLSIGKRELVAN